MKIFFKNRNSNLFSRLIVFGVVVILISLIFPFTIYAGKATWEWEWLVDTKLKGTLEAWFTTDVIDPTVAVPALGDIESDNEFWRVNYNGSSGVFFVGDSDTQHKWGNGPVITLPGGVMEPTTSYPGFSHAYHTWRSEWHGWPFKDEMGLLATFKLDTEQGSTVYKVRYLWVLEHMGA